MSSKTVLLTGVGRADNIAAATALTLARDGWDLALVTWSGGGAPVPRDLRDDVDSLVGRIRDSGRRAEEFSVDLADPAVPDRLLADVHSAFGSVDALVMSHAQSVDSGILDTSVESFDRHFAVNVRAAWLLIAAFARLRQHDSADGLAQPGGRPTGRIVALTSDHVVDNMPYGASKGALDRIVIAAARELAAFGITSNALNPGPVDTGWMDDQTRATLSSLQPTGALGTPQDAANLIRFLLSPEGGWISGQLIKSDGGFSV